MNKKQQLPELPEEIWRNIFLDLDWRDIKSFHLVSSQFHRAANTYPHKLRILIKKDDQKFASNMEVINQSSRHFEAITIEDSDWFTFKFNLTPLKYHHVEELFQKFGYGVKFLKLGRVSISEQDLMKILELLPNLKSLEMFRAKITQEQKIEKTSIDLPQLETVKILSCDGDLSSFLLSLKYKITEFEAAGSDGNIKVLKKWQSTVKKLNIKASSRTELDKVLNLELKDLRLENLSIVYENHEFREFPLLQLKFRTFLSRQENLKYLDLKIKTGQSDNDLLLEAICESLKKLESLKIQVHGSFSNASIRNISKLKSLRSWTVISNLNLFDVLNALNLKVNLNFEELVVYSTRHIRNNPGQLPENLSEKIPNLKKVDIEFEYYRMFYFFLKNFKSLECFSATESFDNASIKYHGNRLEIISFDDFKYPKLEDSGIFGLLPDLEILKITCYHLFNNRGDLMQVLRHFPKLKKFIVIIKNVCGKGEFSNDVADLILQYGKNLRTIEIPYRCNEEEVRKKLKNMNLKFTCLDWFATFPKTNEENKREMRLASKISYDYYTERSSRNSIFTYDSD